MFNADGLLLINYIPTLPKLPNSSESSFHA